VRNVLVSPFAGLDPSAPCDMRPYARAWERELAADRDLWALPTKFGAAFDAGTFPLEVETDLVFTATGPDAFIVRLGGLAEIGPIAGAEIVDTAKALARRFLALRETPTPPKRMRDALAALGLPASAPARRAASARDWLGAHVLGASAFVGVALPFGRIESADLRGLAAFAAEAGATELRLTPWRALIIPGLGIAAARALTEGARNLGLILDPGDPLLSVAACPGAPACSSAKGETRDAARRLAPLLQPGVALHVSGCAKGCARSAPAPYAVVATKDGYDLVRNGRADSAPIARGLALEAIADRLKMRENA
jgi:sulfite reductase beta subunit-like hemoprotein